MRPVLTALQQRLITLLDTSTLDLFIVAGQSNATGQGVTLAGPTPTAGTVFDVQQMMFRQLADPVGSANIGSAWPSFSTDYYTGRSRKTAILDVSYPGSAQCAAASDDNWDTTGTRYGDMVRITRAKIETLLNLGITVTLRGILWCQGERDADQIDDAVIVKAQYKSALEAMIGRIQTDFPTLKLFISRTGTKMSGDTAGFADVRAAQDEVIAASAFADAAFLDAVDFASEGKMQDTFHYTTAGYEEMGSGMAAYVVSDNPAGIVY